MRGVSTRQYRPGLPEMADSVGISRSAVSRERIEAAEAEQKKLLERPLKELDLWIIYMELDLWIIYMELDLWIIYMELDLWIIYMELDLWIIYMELDLWIIYMDGICC